MAILSRVAIIRPITSHRCRIDSLEVSRNLTIFIQRCKDSTGNGFMFQPVIL